MPGWVFYYFLITYCNTGSTPLAAKCLCFPDLLILPFGATYHCIGLGSFLVLVPYICKYDVYCPFSIPGTAVALIEIMLLTIGIVLYLL